MSQSTNGRVEDDRVVCPGCGVILEEPTELLGQLRDDLHGVELELRRKRAEIKRLRREQEEAMRRSPHYHDAILVLERWRELCAPTARELHRGKRLQAVIDRMEGKFSRKQCDQAVSGYARFPYIVNKQRSSQGTSAQWYADAELIFRDAKHVEAGIRMAENAARPVVSADVLEPLRQVAARQLW